VAGILADLPDSPVVAEARTFVDPSGLIQPTEQPGDRIGRYKLLQKIGEGGMGVVYMAEQEEPIRRRVALKIIKLGMDTRQVIARFEAERQALALMDHPNIANTDRTASSACSVSAIRTASAPLSCIALNEDSSFVQS
jgi:serine/threonine protein kinase